MRRLLFLLLGCPLLLAATPQKTGTQTITGATATTPGTVKLTGDLGGTANAPSVVGANNAQVTATGSTTARTLAARAADVVNVKDFGAVGDGVANDTAAFSAAFAASRNVQAPAGTFLVDQVVFPKVLDVTSGRYQGGHLRGAGPTRTIIKARAGTAATNLITIGNTNYGTDGIYSIGNTLEDLTVDGEALPNNAANAVVYLFGTYDNRIENVRIGMLDVPRSRWDLSLGRAVYTTTLKDVHGHQLQLASDTLDRVTTITSVGGSWTFINISKALGLNFVGTTVQGATAVGYQPNRVQISDSYNVTFTGGDFEGTGNLFVISGSQWITSRSNNLMGWEGSAYFVDGGGNARLDLRDNFTYRDRGGFVPTIAGHAGGTATYTAQNGRYQRVGNRIHFNIQLAWSGWSVAPSGVYIITGLPAPVSSSWKHAASVADVTLSGATGQVTAVLNAGGSQINLQYFAAGVTAGIGVANAAGSITVTGTYETDDEALPAGAAGFGWGALTGMP